jgi:hypothetical protein
MTRSLLAVVGAAVCYCMLSPGTARGAGGKATQPAPEPSPLAQALPFVIGAVFAVCIVAAGSVLLGRKRRDAGRVPADEPMDLILDPEPGEAAPQGPAWYNDLVRRNPARPAAGSRSGAITASPVACLGQSPDVTEPLPPEPTVANPLRKLVAPAIVIGLAVTVFVLGTSIFGPLFDSISHPPFENFNPQIQMPQFEPVQPVQPPAWQQPQVPQVQVPPPRVPQVRIGPDGIPRVR